MAVVTIQTKEIMQMTGLEKGQILESLNNIGMPTEENEGEMAVEVTPNRPDLFSIEGIARALNAFHGKKNIKYSAKKSEYSAKIDASVGKARPYFVSAVVKNVRMNEDTLKSLIQLQEKLHETVGRKRKKVAIGLHNADTIAFPLEYRFVKNERFVPLDFEEEMDVPGLLENHPKGRAYAHLVKGGYPMIYDQKGVISFPPIINSERTRVTEKTRNLVVDITGTHMKTLKGVLNIVVCALADRGGEIHEVTIGDEAYPRLEMVKMAAQVDEIGKLLGEKLTKKQIFDSLERLGWSNDGKENALVAPYRMDVSHYADMTEDVAIAHGYNEFEATLPGFFTPGKLAYNNDDVRQAMMGLGFIEVVNYALTNEAKIRLVHKDSTPTRIINPKTEDFTLLRTNLAVSLLDNLAENKTHELPIRIFEIGRAYASKEKIHISFAISAEVVDFSMIRGVLQSISLVMEKDFELKPAKDKLFIAGRGADIYLDGSKVGGIGEIAPVILEGFGIENPVCICEIEINSV